MQNYFLKLSQNPIFNAFSEEELVSILRSSNSQINDYKKNDVIMLSGSEVKGIGIILEGNIKIVKEDINGNVNILMHIEASGIFAEVFVCAGINLSPVTVVADSDCQIMFLNLQQILHSNDFDYPYRAKLIDNLLKIIARKNLALNEKVSCLGQRNIRDKVLVFLLMQLEHAGTNPFEIPYSRYAMADYLCVDRSALSSVLGQMQNDGIIRYNKNKFEIL